LAFILIYLFPLLIIALGYNLLSSERERGTYPILRIQASSVASVVLRKGLFFFSLVMAMALGLSCYGLAVSGAMGARDYPGVLSWLGMVAAYVTFWAAVVLLVVSWSKPSGFNALCLLGGWLLMLVVLPSLINILVAAFRPIDQTHLTDLIRRMGIEDTEAEARKAIHEMAEFRPELAKDSITGPFLMQKGYAAFEENRRRRSKPVVDAYKVEVEMRNRFAEHLNFMNPAVLAQDVLNALARSDLANYWRFQDAMAPFHEEIAEFYIRPLFENRTLKLSELAARPRYIPPPEPNPSRKVIFGLVHMLMLSMAAAVLAWPGLSREVESGGAGNKRKRIAASGGPAKPEPRKKETANA
jgi:ABC-2 type transport system permease protein